MATASENHGKKLQKSLSDRLNCPICLETYKNPRALICMHTFCQGCVHSFIIKQAEKGSISTIECPLCRSPTTPSNINKPPSEWAKELPFNFALLPILETPTVDTESESRMNCDPCSHLNKVADVVSFCMDCQEYQCKECVVHHSRFPQTRNHKMVRIEEMTTEKAAPLKLGKVEYCDTHPRKEIEYHCSDHGTLCCSTCAIVGHRSCQNLVEISELGRGVKAGDTAQNLRQQMNTIHDQMCDVTVAMETNMADLEKQVEDLPQRMKEFRDKVVEAMDKLVLKVSSECSQLKKEHCTTLSDAIFSCKSLIAAITSSCSLLESVLEHGTESQIFIIFSRLERQLKQYETMATEINGNYFTADLNLHLGHELETLVQSVESKLKVSLDKKKIKVQKAALISDQYQSKVSHVVTEDTKTTDSHEPIDTAPLDLLEESPGVPIRDDFIMEHVTQPSVESPVHHDKVIKSPGVTIRDDFRMEQCSVESPVHQDKVFKASGKVKVTEAGGKTPISKCNMQTQPVMSLQTGFGGVTALIHLTDGKLLITQRPVLWKDKKTCSILNASYQKTASIELPASPRSLALLGDTEVVTVLGSYSDLPTIQRISVGPPISLTRIISYTKGRRKPVCVSTFSRSEVAVGWDKGFGVITLEGKEKVYLYRDTAGRKIKFSEADSVVVDVNRSQAYQSSNGNDTVYCFSLTGEPVFTYCNERLKKPRGMALDREGNLYVCSYGNNTVHQVSPAGRLMTVIDTELEGPLVVSFHPDKDRMVVMNSVGYGTQALQIDFVPAGKYIW